MVVTFESRFSLLHSDLMMYIDGRVVGVHIGSMIGWKSLHDKLHE